MKRTMTKEDIDFATKCIDDKDVHRFYCSTKWQRIRDKVMRLDHYECQLCKSKYHRIRKASMVHHVHHLEDYPNLALEIYDEEGHRNLISLCNSCHNEVHPEKQIKFKKIIEAKRKSIRNLNPERW